VSANADIVRRLYEAFNAGDAARDLLDPEIEYVNPRDAVEAGTRHGTQEWNDAIRKIREGFGKGARIEVGRLEESGDQVAAQITMHIEGPSSGLRSAFSQSALWTIHDGKAVRMEWFTDSERAFHELPD
jgi:ketosteroid isomerase-like protein